MNRSLIDFLPEHAGLKPVSFHMPGHKGSELYRDLGYGSAIDNIMDYDITEIPGADNLFQTEDVILAVMEKYRALYGSKRSYLLVNGSSVGLIAAILSSAHMGGKAIMARNSHKSIFNAMTLGRIDPVYLFPEIMEEYGILGGVSPKEVERLIDENPDASCVIIPSPNYYGICSDIRSISDICHEHNKILIVDQAHGAHLKFMGDGYPMSAEDGGADIVIDSTHKTLASWTQTAVMNVMSDRVSLPVIENFLQILESSSPSYPLMMSLDINADILLDKTSGPESIRRWRDAVELFYEEAPEIPGLRIIQDRNLDRTKFNLDTTEWGINGNELETLLIKKNIFVELVTGNIVMGMTGIGTTEQHVRRLLDALIEISGKYYKNGSETNQANNYSEMLTLKLERRPVPDSKEELPLMECSGRVCASYLIPYPPGIPLACPGEVLTEEVLNYVKELRDKGEKVIGVSDKGTVIVGEQ